MKEREQEREQAAVARGHIGFMELEHLREDLEDVGDVLCVADRGRYASVVKGELKPRLTHGRCLVE